MKIDHSETSKVKIVIRKLFILALILLLLLTTLIAFFNIQRYIRESDDSASSAPTNGYFVSTTDAKIFVQEKGPRTGQPILFIHGTGSWSEIWRDNIDPLATAGYRVLSIDLPPFGYSSKLKGFAQYSRQKQSNRIYEVITNLDLQNITLIAHSIGSRPAVELALMYPDKIKKLILVAPALGYPPKEEDAFIFQQNEPTWFMKLLFRNISIRNTVISTYGTNPLSIKKLFSSFVFNSSTITKTRLDVLKRPMSQANTTESYGDWLDNISSRADYSMSTDFNNLGKLRMPVYLVWGDKDKVTPIWAGKKMNSLIPGSRISIIENVGHMPFLENVSKFNSILTSLLKE